MSAYRRNVLVGVTVIGALVILGWMILQFGGSLASPFAPTQLHFRLVTDRADGVSDGTALTYKGVTTGRVEKVYLHDINQVYIDATVDAMPALPANLKGMIRPTGLIGGSASIALELTGDHPDGKLKTDDVIPASYSNLDLIPPEVTSEVQELATSFKQNHVIEDFDATIKHFGVLAQSLQSVTGDVTSQTDLKTSLANIRQSTDNIRKFSDRLDKISTDASDTIAQAKTTLATTSAQVNDRMTQIARLLDNANAITNKVNNGQGTAGQLVNDPKLYASLVDTAQEMDSTVKDLKRLVEQWEQEGVSLHLK